MIPSRAFRRSDGSAVVQFILIVPAMMFCFGAVMACCALSNQKALLTQASAAIAERVSLADVEKAEFDQLAVGVLGGLGLRNARIEVETTDGVNVVHVADSSLAGIELEAVSFGAVEPSFK